MKSRRSKAPDALGDVGAEMHEIMTEWGIQDYPSAHGGCLLYLGMDSETSRSRVAIEEALGGGKSWAAVTIEKLADVLEVRNDKDRRQELVELAATITTWIENIDLREYDTQRYLQSR